MDSPLPLPRFLDSTVQEALADTPVVVIQGARQVGKSTLAAMSSQGIPARAVTLDDDLTRAAAQSDPVSFWQQAGQELLIVDEVQRVPELMLPLKAAVDSDRRPGRFLLTGSADLLQVQGVGDSLAGRAESVELLPMSVGELDRRVTPEDFITWVLTAPRLPTLPRLDHQVVLRGGYPEPSRRTARRAATWFDNYAARLATHDARELHQGGYPADLGRLLRLVASGGIAELVKAKVARDLGISQTTAASYLRLMRTMRLLIEVPAWGRSPRARIIRRPKVALTDTGLSACLAGYAHVDSAGGREYYGALVEQFVALELLKQRAWSEQRFDLFHYRDQDGLEVDLVAELRDGRLVAIEVKSGQTVTAKSWSGLERFASRFPDRDVTGVVLHGGTEAASLHGWLHVLPVTALWQHSVSSR